MNIDQIQKTEMQNTEMNSAEENSKITPQNAESLSFKLEIPNKKSFMEFLDFDLNDLNFNPNEDQQVKNLTGSVSLGTFEKNNPALIKNLRNFASKNRIPFNIKDVNDVKLLIYTQNIFNNDKDPGFKISKMEQSDIDFLKKCVDNPDILINTINPQNAAINYSIPNKTGEISESGVVSYKTLNVSKTLVNIIDYAAKTQKPVRLDFEGNSSVILKVDTEGKLTAEFISSDKAMESLLKNSIPQLRNKMDNEGIPYKEISYKEQSQKKDKNNNPEDKSYE